MLSFTVQENLMFTRFGLPRHIDSFNLNLTGLRNFYVTVTDYNTNKRLSLGVWHLLPWEIIDKNENNITNIDFDEVLANSTYPVLLHFHGTGETRRDGFMMFVTLRLFFHVIAFDYRGYGDSSDGVMTETAVVEDCKQVYKWLRSKTNAKIYVWGRSLGASLGLRTAAELSQQGIVPAGVVVESAFTTMREEIPVHPFGQIYKWLPWLEATILRPLEESGFFFNNSKHIVEVPTPVMMFHAEDDSVIPIRLGQKHLEATTTKETNNAEKHKGQEWKHINRRKTNNEKMEGTL
ncbi:alpha/beta hydrolase domain-containing protein [Holotrichia oblita]|uniref:Alpha/beta hydrolase domain-containing protein n=1 Tax=Holotrichia oblita TaxID=644536 RepID=A0ACB9TXN4_HOLOL|nr:alpha/beta hydrolase domain-containing protein [Holotrichia oblita]